MERELVHKPARRPLFFMFYFRLTYCYTFYSLRLRWDIGHSCSWQLFVCRRFFLDLPFLRISRRGPKKKKFKVRIIKILNIKKSSKGSYLVERHIECFTLLTYPLDISGKSFVRKNRYHLFKNVYVSMRKKKFSLSTQRDRLAHNSYRAQMLQPPFSLSWKVLIF